LSPSSTAGYAVPSRDPTPQLYPGALRGTGGGAGQLDRMRRGHPRVAVGCRDLALAIGSASIEFAPLEDERPSETAFREDLDALLAEVFTDAENNIGGWASLGADLAEYYLAGHYLAECRFVRAPDAAPRRTASLDGLRLELYPVHASSVQAWVAAPPTWQRLAKVTQATPTGYVELPADRLIYLKHGGAPGEWEGVSILRPLVFIVERWISLLTAAERNSYFGAGVAKVAAPMAETPADRDRMLDTLEAWQSGAAPWLLMPPGYEVDLSYPGGAAGDPRAALEYLDAQIDNALGRALYSLGYSSRGSLALGQQVEAADGWQTTAQLDLLLAEFGRRVGEWVARRIGYAGRVPVLRTVGEESANTAERVTMLAQAAAAGLVSWQADDEDRMRAELGLDPRETRDETRALLVGQIQAASAIVAQMAPADPLAVPLAPGAARELLTAAGVPADSADRIIAAQLAADAPRTAPAPATFADESFPVPKGVADEAETALAWRREHGRGGTEVGVARARDLKNRRPVSLDTLKRIKAYFDRHESDTDAEGFRPGEPGFPSAGRIAWGLWGGNPARRWAEDRLAGVEARDCCLADRVEVIGADGVPFQTWRPLDGVECAVAWASNDAQRSALDSRVEASIGEIAERHRAAVWAAVADGWNPDANAAAYDEFLAEYRDAVSSFASTLAAAVEGWAKAEQRAQRRAGLPTVGPNQGAGPGGMPSADAILSRIGPRIDIAADEIANRVQGEVETAWTAGGTEDGFTSRITAGGLARPALAVGNAIESEGRVAAAGDLATNDLVITEVMRTSVLDGNRCAHCAEFDGTTFAIPEQLDDYRAMVLPDKECAGGPDRCRCGWLVVWGQRA
jgi:hypothetical protein